MVESTSAEAPMSLTGQLDAATFSDVATASSILTPQRPDAGCHSNLKLSLEVPGQIAIAIVVLLPILKVASA